MVYKGYPIEINQDESAEDPREWDNLGVMYCKHTRYNLGDKNAEPPAKEDGQIHSLPLYLYDHSGITMNTTGFSCGWDSSHIGIIYITHARVIAEGLEDRAPEQIHAMLKAEVKTYDDYLTGNCYGYNIPDLEDASCYGYYGYDHEASGLLESARGDIDWQIQHARKVKHNKIKTWIRCRVPLNYRLGEII